MKSKLFRLFFLLTLLVGIVFVPHASAAWDWDLTDGTLTINTFGVADYPSDYPWHDERSSITTVLITDGVPSIGNCAFDSCSSLTKVTIPNSVSSIGEWAFSECDALRSIIIPDSTSSIGEYAFSNCSALNSVLLGKNVSSLGASAFSECEALTNIIIPDSLSRIAPHTFTNCGFLTIYMPSSITNIDPSSFEETDIKMMYVTENSYAHTYAVKNNIPYSFHNIPVTDITLSQTTLNMIEGSTHTLTAIVTPANASDTTVTWKSSDDSVVTVNDGIVTAISADTAIITATSMDGSKAASCLVAVSSSGTIPPIVPPTEDVPQIVLTGAKTSTDTTVTVDVSIANNPGFISLNLEIDYDPTYLTLTGITANSGVGATFTKAQSYTKVPYNFSWSSTNNVYYNGSLATLTFTVSADAPDGVYPITVSYYKGVNGNYTDGKDVNFDTNYEPLNLSYVSGNIAVTSYTPGDADGSGSINDRDATYMLRYLAGWDISGIVIDALDVDGSGTINDRDATILLRYLAGWDVELK
ncbi:MAG: leucine-rich repeat protein [Clostridia bacterium]|nr:leucine-rich repeat protein [Clostridia bacterium]